MTKEQAIERLKSKIDNDKEYLEQCNPFSELVNEVRLDNKSIETVLSMLKQQELEISLLKQTHNYDVKMIDEVKGKAVELYNRIKEKEKLINALVDYITEEDIDELVCKHIRCVDNEEESNCRECVKKFFESKIKESEN